MKSVLVLLSGGIDSAVALWWARTRYRVRTLSFDIASRPRGEVRACDALVRSAEVSHVRVPLPFLQYRRNGYIPARNLVFHSVALSLAEEFGASVVVAGHTLSDARHFKDARADFFRRFQRLANGIRIVLPFARMTDRDVVRLGRRLGVPLDLTWSCYRDGARPCRHCEACRDRSEILVGEVVPVTPVHTA